MKGIVARYRSGTVDVGQPCERCGKVPRMIQFVTRSDDDRVRLHHEGCGGLLGWGPRVVSSMRPGAVLFAQGHFTPPRAPAGATPAS